MSAGLPFTETDSVSRRGCVTLIDHRSGACVERAKIATVRSVHVDDVRRRTAESADRQIEAEWWFDPDLTSVNARLGPRSTSHDETEAPV
jgi:hypothetical protein